MKFLFRVYWAAAIFGAAVSTGATPRAELHYVEGRVLLRSEDGKKMEPAKTGRLLAEGEVLITGDATRFEARLLQGGGVWRVGRRAVFQLKEGGARLLAGTALVQVPAGATWRLESRGCVVGLPAGSWLVHAVDNRGFKIVCLDGEAPVQAWGEPAKPADAAVAVLALKPGDLTFVQPGGRAFSPVVTIYLEETLATSRLVSGFPEELPGMRRLLNQAIAQRERLTGLGAAVVLGAPEAGGFQIAVPDPKAEPPAP